MENQNKTKAMSKLEEIPEWIIAYDKAKYQSSAGKAVSFLMEYIRKRQESHREEIEALERKAWECSVEMMETHRDHLDTAENPLKVNSRKERESGIAYGWKMAAYKLREAFGFPKSETPEKFKSQSE